LNNFQPIAERQDKGAIYETACYKKLSERFGSDAIFYWRTADGNEVDFVLPNVNHPFAMEVKYDQSAIKASKYNKFTENYKEIPLHFNYFQPFSEDFFRQM
jgi:predicted AAA+ superfamily ATPase